MRTPACVLLLATAAAPSMAAAAPQDAPMTEPPPRMVVRSGRAMRQDRTARPPAMGQSTHAIMMPGQDMPRPAPAGAAQPRSAAKPPP